MRMWQGWGGFEGGGDQEQGGGRTWLRHRTVRPRHVMHVCADRRIKFHCVSTCTPKYLPSRSSPGADVGGVSPVPAPMRRGEPSHKADVASTDHSCRIAPIRKQAPLCCASKPSNEGRRGAWGAIRASERARAHCMRGWERALLLMSIVSIFSIDLSTYLKRCIGAYWHQEHQPSRRVSLPAAAARASTACRIVQPPFDSTQQAA